MLDVSVWSLESSSSLSSSRRCSCCAFSSTRLACCKMDSSADALPSSASRRITVISSSFARTAASSCRIICSPSPTAARSCRARSSASLISRRRASFPAASDAVWSAAARACVSSSSICLTTSSKRTRSLSFSWHASSSSAARASASLARCTCASMDEECSSWACLPACSKFSRSWTISARSRKSSCFDSACSAFSLVMCSSFSSDRVWKRFTRASASVARWMCVCSRSSAADACCCRARFPASSISARSASAADWSCWISSSISTAAPLRRAMCRSFSSARAWTCFTISSAFATRWMCSFSRSSSAMACSRACLLPSSSSARSWCVLPCRSLSSRSSFSRSFIAALIWATCRPLSSATVSACSTWLSNSKAL
mmetsp:Transcript_25068/g.72182  ORF Transcript_25068/g.72182 Transcript_25068/m.72182 type:complete len:373 (+) Transcript_25068:1259-2377(+)